jgi:hypothetical protein
MKRQISFVLLLLWLCIASGCDWFRRKDPETQLPPETQTGANTFGCLLNGKVWLPEGFRGPLVSPNFEVVYDPTYKEGWLSVNAFQYLDNETIGIGISGASIAQIGTYPLNKPVVEPARAAGYSSNACEYLGNLQGVYCNGSLTITRLDMQQGIVSGRFEFVLAKQGCDTIKVTQGRFDKKL